MSRGRISLLWIELAIATLAPLSLRAQQPGAQQPSAQQPPPPKEEASLPPDDSQLPPEEDKAKIKETYSFNPLQSKKDVTVGEEYFKKGSFNAAASRFREATKWNDGNSDAWLRLGDAEAKLKDMKAAQEAWEKYLQLAPEAKNAAEVRKKLEKLKS
jgi:tetratricopeptide (TPR) repeat protein